MIAGSMLDGTGCGARHLQLWACNELAGMIDNVTAEQWVLGDGQV